jgi:hypothetical protein
MNEIPKHMERCPVCGVEISYDACKHNLFAVADDGLDNATIALYAHLNDSTACECRFPVCPECGKSYDDKHFFSWRRLAVHWRCYGHLLGEEHVIASALGEESL